MTLRVLTWNKQML